MSKHSRVIEAAFLLGYRVSEDGVVSKPDGVVLAGTVGENGYRKVSVTIPALTTSKGYQIYVHKLAAYQKYGAIALSEGTDARHRNGNRLDNRLKNILIGTRHDNIMDMTPEQRSMRVRGKPSPHRLLNDRQVAEIRQVYRRGLRRGECASLASKLNVSKSVVSSIGRGDTYAEQK